MRQRFVKLAMAFPQMMAVELARMVGHKGNYDAVKKWAQRAMTSPDVNEAFKEASAVHLTSLLPRVNKALAGIVENQASQYKAIDGILNRTGLHEIQESRKTVVHQLDAGDLGVDRRGMPHAALH